MRLGPILIGLLISLSASASITDFFQKFYTDDSAYYLKLTPDGFIQRFRVEKDECSNLKSATINLPKTQTKVNFKAPSSTWPKLHGINSSDYCWAEAVVTGLNLNTPEANKYVIELQTSYDSTPFYFGDVAESFLPENRISKNISQVKPFSLGSAGATLVAGGGVFYKIWEPTAEEVHIKIGRANSQLIKMIPDQKSKSPDVHYVYYDKNSKEGTLYGFQFIKDGAYELVEIDNTKARGSLKVDPYARELSYLKKGGSVNGYVDPYAVVASIPNYNWSFDSQINSLSQSDRDNRIIYQIWPATFNPINRSGKDAPGTISTITDKLSYIEDLGVNTVELLPINETRFHSSWGYALDSLFLIEKNLGTRTDVMRMVDTFHQKKIQVMFDVVLNHVNNTLIRDPLSKTVSSSKFYSGNTDWGPRPDFKKVQVRKWIYDALISMINDYHIDGFRFDMIASIYTNDAAGYQFLQELNTLLKVVKPTFYSSAEELPDNVWATLPVTQKGMGFDSQWNDQFKNFFELQFDSYREFARNVNIHPLRQAIEGFSDHYSSTGAYSFGGPLRTVNYLGSHDFIGNKNPLLRIISDYRATEVCGQNRFYLVRPLNDPNIESNFSQIHNNFTHATQRAGYAILFTKPGASLFYQGEEVAQDLNIENEWSYLDAKENNSLPTKDIDLNRFIGSHKMVWEYLHPESEPKLSFLDEEQINLFKGHRQLFKDLIAFRKNNPDLNIEDAKVLSLNQNSNLLTYTITSDDRTYFVIANLGYRKEAEWISFPGSRSQWWKERFNTSDKKYGGFSNKFLNIIPFQGGRANHIRLEGTTVAIFEQSNDFSLTMPLYLRGSFNSWLAHPGFIFKELEDGVFSTSFTVEQDDTFEFKLATSDWQIDIGTENEIPQSSGILTYKPDRKNIKSYLKKGSYSFRFTLRDFSYEITRN